MRVINIDLDLDRTFVSLMMEKSSSAGVAGMAYRREAPVDRESLVGVPGRELQ